MLFAAVLGYFMIYGLVSDIYLSVITLVVTLILEKGIRSTSGPEHRHRRRAPQWPERHPGRAVPAPAVGSATELFVDGDALPRHPAAGLGVHRPAAAARDPLRPRAGGDPRERAPHRPARLRQPALQARGLRAGRRHRGAVGCAVRGLGQLRGARDVQPQPSGPGRDLGDRRRQVDPDRADRRHRGGAAPHAQARHHRRSARSRSCSASS